MERPVKLLKSHFIGLDIVLEMVLKDRIRQAKTGLRYGNVANIY